ncbi:MAG: ribonuclease HII [Candidatus Nealsonbacteria bacterium CG_4_10_14_0_2_um_filter_40_15]|uniref:Ribonuclease HII n=2 Tax=Candidatus Nealsoniibacteriota TaxID=1817911 RepID=A0A2M7D7T5_9BACT|nr:MAG: ribonuclease HII [Candidatus Nealsonbacteria bacterium CG02_land_8_20_14_3_00_40_11]PIZ86903.1 MAG: ribonuclease HII [Candidatus Nealsonbacteria bacterium CG_4_10_14_0_2_um_filter_40_15]
MRNPNFQEEKKLRRKGFKRVAGSDEAGRGPLAGPVVAAAVIIQNTKYKILNTKIRDSKQLSAKQRDKFYDLITKNKNIKWGIGVVSERIIDRINILEATKLAMAKAVKKLKVDFLLLDGNFKINSKILQKSIIKGDERVFSIAAASILAKVARDRIMVRYHKKYPRYRFDMHKGYPTKYHCKMIRKYGPCKIHRRSFAPIKFEIRISKSETN